MAEDEAVRDFKKQLSRQSTGLLEQVPPGSPLAVPAEASIPSLRSSSSVPALAGEPLYPELGRAGDIAQPGGFRREHILRSSPTPNSAARRPLLETMETLLDPRIRQFLELQQMQEEACCQADLPAAAGSSDWSTVLVILKSTVGGTLIIIPGAFASTGYLAAPLLLLFIGGVEMYCMVLLIKCVRALGGGSYGDIARTAMGRFGSWAVDVSMVLSQLGFVCAEMLYLAKNSHGALEAFGVESLATSVNGILLLQLLVVVPMAWIRQLKYFQVSNLIANTTVLAALVVLLSFSAQGLIRHGAGPDLHPVCPSWMLFTGTVVFSFECINFVIPMYEAHEKKETFVPILVSTLMGVCLLFIVFGGVNYVYYGAETRSVVTLNLPRGSKVGKVIPFAFALASLFNVPLFLFPAVALLESKLFSSRVRSHAITWKKNSLRTLLTLLCVLVSAVGADSVEALVSLIGSLCCVPLAFIFPVICHIKVCNPSPAAKALDMSVLALGLVLFVYTSMLAFQQF
eukprot:TRINITY_DN22547_c0_g1_i1.p1 TRINITY_DN22547_c0_g1~~TRINITY_DN22547_c0_g1_i1.p1  ORF type:complete len:514 (+),score=95.33 TRINITY_DN22547_c0_g1_i1:54-1595(+)